MQFDYEKLSVKFCNQAFNNMEYLLKSRRIGCFLCGYIFIYDGTEDTEPMSLDGNCGMCPACDNFSLFGDASGEFSRSELLDCSAYLKMLRTDGTEEIPPEIKFFLECSFNTGKIRQCSLARCLSCGAKIIPGPPMFLDIFNEPVPDDRTFVCCECLAPTVVAENKT